MISTAGIAVATILAPEADGAVVKLLELIS